MFSRCVCAYALCIKDSLLPTYSGGPDVMISSMALQATTGSGQDEDVDLSTQTVQDQYIDPKELLIVCCHTKLDKE